VRRTSAEPLAQTRAPQRALRAHQLRVELDGDGVAFDLDEIGRLEELRLLPLEQRLEADLSLDRHAHDVPVKFWTRHRDDRLRGSKIPWIGSAKEDLQIRHVRRLRQLSYAHPYVTSVGGVEEMPAIPNGPGGIRTHASEIKSPGKRTEKVATSGRILQVSRFDAATN
jgi:hypothetical protein